MTRKDYVLIAEALARGAYEGMDETRKAVHRDYCTRVAYALASDNPRFDRARFLAACGVQP